MIQPGMKIRVARHAIPGTAVARYVPSVEAAARELSLTESVGLRDAIGRTAAWYRHG